MTAAPATQRMVRPEGRNLTLDFFRGFALIIILINHMPNNPWYWVTPSRFAVSDATEVFVFISGFVSALSFGRFFERAGWGRGSLKVASRFIQIYAAHLLMFGVLVLVCLAGNRAGIGPDYIQELNLRYALDNPEAALQGLVTLTYVPNYFDILPMYMVVLLLIPVFIFLARVHKALAIAFSIGLYALTWLADIKLTADIVDGRPWFFNPFAWQMVFFTGFAFGAGYIKVPKANTPLLLFCGALMLLSGWFEFCTTFYQWPSLMSWKAHWWQLLDKSNLGLLRYVHLLAAAYLVCHLFKVSAASLSRRPISWVTRLGQQSLFVFVASMILSYVAGMALDYWGREWLAVAMVNICAIGALLFSAKLISYLTKRTPATMAVRAPVVGM